MGQAAETFKKQITGERSWPLGCQYGHHLDLLLLDADWTMLARRRCPKHLPIAMLFSICG